MKRKKRLTLTDCWMRGDDGRSWQLSIVLLVGTTLLLPIWVIELLLYLLYVLLNKMFNKKGDSR